MSRVSIEHLLEAGAHFGHLTRRWNPKMRNFIFGERNGIHIIDLRKTQLLIDIAHDAALEVASKGQKFLFVGTKKQAKEAISAEASRAGCHYVTDRWLGGMLTNFPTVRKSIKRLESIEKMENDGTFEKLKKKERLMISREKEKLERVFGGIRTMTRLPGALFVVDIKKEHIAVSEAKKLGIPVFAIVDTNCDPNTVEYPIAANDDSIRTIEILAKVMADAVAEGREYAKARNAEDAAGSDREFKEGDGGDASSEDARVRRRMRQRRRRDDEGEAAETPAGEAQTSAE